MDVNERRKRGAGKQSDSGPAPSTKGPAAFKVVGGSESDSWNSALVNQALSSVYHGDGESPELMKKRQDAAFGFLLCFKPQDQLEGMLAAQLLASHNAAMECYRRAMIPNQTFDGRKENLSQANKLSRTHAALLEALNRHRGKGQQKVTVEHVHVYSGGQAIVGNVEGGGMQTKPEKQPHALGYGPGETLWSEDTKRDAVPVASNAQRKV